MYLAGYNLIEFEKIIYKYVLNDAMKYFRLFAERDKSERENENSKLEFYAAIHGIKVELNTAAAGGMTEDEKLQYEYGDNWEWVKANLKNS